MSDLKDSLLNAKYIDIISLADFVVRDCGLPDMDDDGNLMPQANEIAAALFRWAAGATTASGATTILDEDAGPSASFDEYDENGDPLMDAETAEKREADLKVMAQPEETK